MGFAFGSNQPILQNRFRHDPRRLLGDAGEQHAADLVLGGERRPRLKPVADAVGGSDQRGLVDQRIGDRGGGFLFSDRPPG